MGWAGVRREESHNRTRGKGTHGEGGQGRGGRWSSRWPPQALFLPWPSRPWLWGPLGPCSPSDAAVVPSQAARPPLLPASRPGAPPPRPLR